MTLDLRTILFLVLLMGLVIGTIGWIGDILDIRPWWFEIAGFVIVIPTGIVLKFTKLAR